MYTTDDLTQKLKVGRTTVYAYFKILGTPIIRNGNRTLVDEFEFTRLKELADWAKENPGIPLKNFPGIMNKNTSELVPVKMTEALTQTEEKQLSLFDFMNEIKHEVKLQLDKLQSPIAHWDELDKSVRKKYLLTTTEITKLIGTRPSGVEYIRGAFKFTKVGKIGGQSAWKVTRIDS
jgi:hypothetical protein